jgi:co-chaperonin GroES (HSP10)
MSVNVTPLHDRVLVKRIEEKETLKRNRRKAK